MTCQIFLCAPVSRRIEGTSWCKNSVQIFSTLQKKLLNSLLEKTGQVLRECPERGQWPGARASGCGESRNGGRWVSRDHPHPPRPRWAKGANQLGATHMWDCHTRSGEAFSNLGYILLNLGHTLPNLSKKIAKLEQHIVNLEPHIVKLGILVDWPTQLTLAIWVCQLFSMINTIEKYEKTQPRKRAI